MQEVKRIKLLTTVLALSLCVGITGCKDDEKLPLYEAKGYVLGRTGPCEGNALYIEVTNPKGIGKKGTFEYRGSEKESTWNYKNAIDVPHFDKINLPVELMKEGTFLYFEYREYTPETDQHYFQYDGFCTLEKVPPTATTYVITKIISYKVNKE